MKQLLVVAALAASARAGTCPSQATLDALAKDAWGGGAVRPRCTPIRAGERLTLVVDVATFDGKPPPSGYDPIRQGGFGYAAIVDDSGGVRWHQNSWADTPGTWYDWQLVDLDGDGHDELVADAFHSGHMGASSEQMLVYAVDRLQDVPSALPLGDYLPAKGFEQNSCTSTHRLVRDGKRTVIEIAGKRGTDPALTPVNDGACPEDGTHAYHWTGTGLAEKH